MTDTIQFKPCGGGVQVEVYARGKLLMSFEMTQLDFATMVTQGSRAARLPDPWKRG